MFALKKVCLYYPKSARFPIKAELAAATTAGGVGAAATAVAADRLKIFVLKS